MKKLAVIISVLLALTVFSWNGTIYIWDFPAWNEDGDNYGWIKKMIAEFEESHPGVNIRLTEIPWSGGDKKLDLAVASRNWPDITRGPLKAHYAAKEVLVPVDEFISNKGDYYEAALLGASYKGKLYGFPFYMTTKVVFINLDLFKKRGVEVPTLNDPWTFDEFMEAAKTLTFDEDGDGKVDYFGFAASGFPAPDNVHLWPFLLSYGGKLFEEKDGKLRCVIYNQKNIEALKWLKELFQKYAPPYMAAYGDADAYNLFRSGKVAIYVTGTWAVPAFRRANLNFDIVAYPVKNKGDRIWSIGDVSSYQIFLQKDEKKLKTIVEFVKYITSAEQQKNLTKYGQFPTLKPAGDIYKEDPLMQKAAIISQHNYIIPPNPAKDKILEVISREIQMVLLGKENPETALKKAQDMANKLLEKF
ncbi:MAG: sugar ABC transporter substrate-binding protein [Thermotogaceae bacterium]|nr:sugar ABC transporter substrate-binding protein [Thermotogaceae bacterium]